jgi:DNA-binding IclR family transcriptional regulator
MIPAELESRLRKVREQGFESMASLQISEVTNLSVPIFGPVGGVIAALTCPYTRRLDRAEAPTPEAALELLIAAGKEISQRQDMAGTTA